MSEKTYLLSAGDLDEYARLAILCHESQDAGMFDAAGSFLGKIEALMQEHEHRERTCRLIPNEGHHGTDGLGWNCSECDYEFDEYQHQTVVFCQNCGAKVVE